MAFIAVLVESHHGGKRKRCAFQTDDEQQEVTGRNHEIHAEKCHKQQFVELSAAHDHQLPVSPFTALDKHDENTHIEYILDHGAHIGCGIHSGEGINRADIAPKEACHGEQEEQPGGETGNAALCLLRHERVVKEHQQEHNQHADFLSHCKELRIIHIDSAMIGLWFHVSTAGSHRRQGAEKLGVECEFY